MSLGCDVNLLRGGRVRVEKLLILLLLLLLHCLGIKINNKMNIKEKDVINN